METELSFIEDFAAHLGVWLADTVPGIRGRTFAVSEVDPFTVENMPRLPIGFVASTGQRFDQFPQYTETFVAEIVLDPVRAMDGGSETPIWAYYDVDAVRDAVLSGLPDVEYLWGKINPVSVEVDVNRLAVYISLTFTRRATWVDPKDCGAPIQTNTIGGIRILSGPLDEPIRRPE